jgi:alkylation response protein AidB-like acyl-CoA dehydrogenase
MDFEFSDEQRQLGETLERYLTREYPFERYRAIVKSADGWSREVWQGLADLGVLAVNVPTAHGGLGAGPPETLALMQVCGAHLLLEPLIGSAVIATTLLNAFAADAAVAQLLQQLASGERIAIVAHEDVDARSEPAWVSTRAQSTATGYRLSGQKAVVLHAAQADVLLVSARTAGSPGEQSGVSLFRVARDAAGLRLVSYPTLSGICAAEVYLQDVELPSDARLGEEGAAQADIEIALAAGLAAWCADAVSAMQALLDTTVEYLRTRQQFGQPIGRFQALQHRVADMVVHLEQARSMSYLATLRAVSTDRDEQRRALSAAKVVIGQAARFIGQQAVQLHGGMGMTDALIVGHYFKRLTAFELMAGDVDTHLQRFATLSRTISNDATYGLPSHSE